MRCPERSFSMTASLSAYQLPRTAPADSTSTDEHHALRDLELAREQARQPVLELVGFELAQVAEQPHVHAHQRHRRRVHELHRVQHRAVAAERDREVETGREVVGLGRVRVETGRPARARRERAPRRPCAANHAALRCASSCATGPIAVRHEADATRRCDGVRSRRVLRALHRVVERVGRDGRGTAPGVHEELDVAVGAAQRRRHHRADTRARRRRARRRPRAAPPRAPRDRARSRAGRAGPGPLRTAASRAGRSRRRRWSARADSARPCAAR